jgi:PhnB protein
MDNINADCVIYLNDIFEEKKAGSNISLMLQLGCETEINNLYAKISKQGNVIFALQKTFWGSYHAVVTDCFGTTWSLDYSGR